MINILRKAGFVFQTIFEVYPDNAHESVLDPEWIAKCGENNWVVITGDKRIETVPENREAVIDAKVKVFLLNDSNSKPEVWAAAIILGQYKMQDIIDGTAGPVFVTVGKRCDSHVQRPRRPAGYLDPSVGPVVEVSALTSVDAAGAANAERPLDVTPVKPDEENPKHSEDTPELPFS